MKAEQWSDNEIRITDCYLYRESIKEIAGRRYEPESKAWFVPLTVANVELLKMLGAELSGELAVMVEVSDAGGGAAADEEPLFPMPISITPYKHQIRGFNRCMENDGYGLLFQVGLGKSATAIAAAGARFQRGEVKRLLIVCPLAVQSVWERECKNLTVEYSARLLEGSMVKRRDALRLFPKDGLQIAVINYEGARVMSDDLVRWQPDMLIVDESQRVKDVVYKVELDDLGDPDPITADSAEGLDSNGEAAPASTFLSNQFVLSLPQAT